MAELTRNYFLAHQPSHKDTERKPDRNTNANEYDFYRARRLASLIWILPARRWSPDPVAICRGQCSARIVARSGDRPQLRIVILSSVLVLLCRQASAALHSWD